MTSRQKYAERFDDRFRSTLIELIRMRRDVRHFRREAIPEGTVERLISLACFAPSVGFSQPWRWIRVTSPGRRAAILENYRRCNAEALRDYSGDQGAMYARLKLAGLVDAPVQLAVFADLGTVIGHRLGVKTMPEMLSYSAVCAVNTLWLAARADNIGIGWVSILDPEEVVRTLDTPPGWKLIAYLCLGYEQEERDRPELETEGWEKPQPSSSILWER